MKISGQYAKAITAVIGEAIAYMQLYGTTWHPQAALVMAGAALAVFGVPNAPKPGAPAPPVLPSNVTITNPPPFTTTPPPTA